MTRPAQARDNKRGFGSVRTYAWPPLPPHDFEVISVTSAIDGGLPKPALIGWAAKITAEKAVKNHATVAQMIESGQERDAVEYLKRARYGDSGAKADRGTIVHSALESFLDGRTLSEDDIKHRLEEAHVPTGLWRSTAKMIEGIYKYLDHEEPEVYWSESTVYSRTHGYAGTADLIAKVRVGDTRAAAVLDVKTAKSIYDDVALQLVAYARADFVGLDDGTEAPLTPDGSPIEYGVVIRPTPSGEYETATFALTDDVYGVFLNCLGVAKGRDALATSRRP